MRRLWERMAAMFGHKWVSVQGMSPQDDAGRLTIAGETWAEALAGLTPAQLGAGVDACKLRTDPWPPTHAEFKALCLGVPSLAELSLEYRDLLPRTRFGLLVWQTIDAHRWRMASPEQRERILADTYAIVRELVLRGCELPELPDGLLAAPKAPPVKLASPETVQRAREELGYDGRAAAAGPDA